jgi:hypothetical protein
VLRMPVCLRARCPCSRAAACAQGCKSKGAGYVTFHKGTARSEGAATACIQTARGQGICWPGGASGYNINQFLDA